ncbi:unnamed protein product [Rhodiola kirilowii]
MKIAKSKNEGEVLTWDDIQKMKYSWNVACEVMRLAHLCKELSGRPSPTLFSTDSPSPRVGSCIGAQLDSHEPRVLHGA